MKIGILTLPLHTNYGGNIQAFALMTVLKKMGHEVLLIDRKKNRITFSEYLLGVAKRVVSRHVLNKKDVVVFLEEKRKKEYPIIASSAIQFINNYVSPQTKSFYSSEELAKGIDAYYFDAIIVGSDQVWRPKYAPNIQDYFLGFLKDRTTVKRIAYAPSFATSDWEFSSREQKECGQYLKKFNSVSVREDSGVHLCRSKFNVQAEHVLDPTMLLETTDYLAICKNSDLMDKSNKDLLVYILDMNNDKKIAISSIRDNFGYTDFYVNNNVLDKRAPVEDRVYPPVENWLAGFAKAKYVVTDSFHACVFSILFNKPFIVYANKQRGVTRFESLLKMFGLERRMILSSNELDTDLLHEQIDWSSVNSILQNRKESSLDFLKKALEG